MTFRPINYSSTGSVSFGTGAALMPLSADPFLQGSGPAVFSTCTELSVVPAFIFDVNGYYRELGVPTNATRKQLRMAYYDVDGQSSSRLTYVLKQLLNPAVRAEYDACPLGSRFLDRYVEAAIRAKVMREHQRRMAERRAAGMVVSEQVEKEVMKRLFRDVGMDANFDDDTPVESLDETPDVPQDVNRPAKSFGYAYYLWRTHVRSPDDLMALATWQELLVSAFSKRGARTQIAVGLLGGLPHPWVLARVGYREVIFLNRLEPPTAALAERAAAEWLDQHNPFIPSQGKILL